MDKFPNGLYAVFICLTLAFSGCQQSGDLITPPCSQDVPGTELDSIPDKLVDVLTLMHSITTDLEIETYEEFLTENFGSDGGSELNEILGDELESYAQLGFEGYIDDKVANEFLSEDGGTYFKDFYSELSEWLETNEPNEEDITTYLDNASNEVDEIGELCSFEKYQAKLYHKSILGWYKFMAWGADENSLTSLQYRDCNWWQSIICGAGGAVVAVVTAGATFVVVMAGQLTTPDGPVPPGSQAHEDFAAVSAIAAGIFAGIDFFEWCCRQFGKNDCVPPTGKVYVNAVDCDEYILHIATVSEGAIYYIWTNTNMTPAVETTYVRNLAVVPVNPSLVSSTVVQVRCIDGNGTSNYTVSSGNMYLSDYSEVPPPNPTWLWAPPPTATVNSTHNLAVLVSGYEHLVLEWSALYGVTFNSTGPFSTEVTFTSTGTIGLKAKVTNTCSNTYGQLSAFVNVTN